MNNKPVVNATLADSRIEVGARITIIPDNHPNKRLNGRICYTSTCIAILGGRSFETRNTIYHLQ